MWNYISSKYNIIIRIFVLNQTKPNNLIISNISYDEFVLEHFRIIFWVHYHETKQVICFIRSLFVNLWNVLFDASNFLFLYSWFDSFIDKVSDWLKYFLKLVIKRTFKVADFDLLTLSLWICVMSEFLGCFNESYTYIFWLRMMRCAIDKFFGFYDRTNPYQ